MTKRIETKRMGMAGFTLIELMIVIAIIGILAAIAIPNFMYARNKSMYSGCLESATTVSKGLQSYLTENNSFANLANPLEDICNHVLPGYDKPGDCNTGTIVEDRIKSSCDDQVAVSVQVDTPAPFQYEIKVQSADKTQCQICVTEVTYDPKKYDKCPTDLGCVH